MIEARALRRIAFSSVLRGAAAVLLALAPAGQGAAQPGDEGKMKLGRQVFLKIAQPQCGICHTLAHAGTTGEIGVKLDELKADEQKVLQAVRQGSGVMPRYDDKLTKDQIEAVAYYVSRAVRLAK